MGGILMPKWNPIYVMYAEAHGRTPEDQMENDKVEWPGGKMIGFILWVSKQRREGALK
jgi:hypothetical protein